jgi:UDP-2-acetamido-3-amino-2,3-dideoxy-glucuronate N-acetyltransferase
MSITSPPFIHPLSDVAECQLGSGTRVWQFVVILKGAKIGRDCNLCAHVLVEGDVIVGDRVTIKSGVQLWNGTVVGNDVFIGPNATFTNDKYPKSRHYPDRFLSTIIEDEVSIGANAVLLPGIRIGKGARIGAGAVVTKDVPPEAVVVGNPARQVQTSQAAPQEPINTPWVNLPRIADSRGSLTVIEACKHIPFEIKRVYYLYDLSSHESRGHHAHKELRQLMVALNGEFDVHLDDGYSKSSCHLSRPDRGLLIEPYVWHEMTNFSHGTVCLLLASAPYDEADYFREYAAFLSAARARAPIKA